MSRNLLTRRQALSSLLAITGGALALAGCAPVNAPAPSGSESTTAAPPAAAGPAKIVFADYVYDLEDQNKIVEMWNESHPDIQVEGQFAPWETYWTKIQTQIAGGLVPDVIDCSIAYIVVLAFRNGLLNVEPLIERDAFPIQDFAQGAVNAFRWEYGQIATGKGPLWGIPSSAQCAHMFFYNKSLFDAEGIAYPDETWDWNDLIEAGAAMTKDTDGDGAIDQWGVSAYPSAYMMWWPSTWQQGGEWFDAEFKTCLAESEQSLAGLRHVTDLFQTHRIAPLPGSMQTDPFLTGKVAMAYDGFWAATMSYADISEFDWDVAVPPAAPGNAPITDLEEDAWSIMSGSKQVDAAWEFVKWLNTGEGGEYNCQYVNAGFPYRPIADKYTYTRDRTTPPKSLYLYGDLIANGHTSYVAASWGEFSSAADAEMQAAAIGEKTVEEAARDTAAKVNQILSDAWKKYTG